MSKKKKIIIGIVAVIVAAAAVVTAVIVIRTKSGSEIQRSVCMLIRCQMSCTRIHFL